jgi:phosphocarrier protein
VTAQAVSRQFTIINERGLHARAATKIVQVAGRYDCDVFLVGPDGQSANAKSVMGMLLLCGSMGTSVEVQATGADAEAAVRAIGELIADRFGEPA